MPAALRMYLQFWFFLYDEIILNYFFCNKHKNESISTSVE